MVELPKLSKLLGRKKRGSNGRLRWQTGGTNGERVGDEWLYIPSVLYPRGQRLWHKVCLLHLSLWKDKETITSEACSLFSFSFV